MGAAGALLLYADGRFLLHSAVDDRYGQLARFWRGRGLGHKFGYAVAFFFCHGVRDVIRMITLLAFDLFIVFAFLAPFWRYVFFEDFNVLLAIALALAGVSAYLVWKLWRTLDLCRMHAWSEETWCCERCGEYSAAAEDRARKTSKSAGREEPELTWRDWLSWHGLWQRRLERIGREIDEHGPRPAG